VECTFLGNSANFAELDFIEKLPAIILWTLKNVIMTAVHNQSFLNDKNPISSLLQKIKNHNPLKYPHMDPPPPTEIGLIQCCQVSEISSAHHHKIERKLCKS
jgi:hypothetical protein